MTNADDVILLTGATGYIGGRLRCNLENLNCAVRCMVRNPHFLSDKVAESTEVVQADVLDPESLVSCFANVHTAYYLIHSMGTGKDFEQQDRIAARNFANAAAKANVKRIIYLGGLGDSEKSLSPHLRSRHEVGDILRESGVPVLEFRASIVIGSGSLSFEMIRSLVERLPIMVTPRWVSVLAQPIAIEDLISYLTQALDVDVKGNSIFEIGGADQVSYGDIMREYASQRGLKRRMIKVPFLTPHLSSLWLGLVTPVYARVGRKLINSICHETVITDAKASGIFDIVPMKMSVAIARAIQNEEEAFASTRWSDAVSSAGAQKSWAGARFGTRFLDQRERITKASPEKVFDCIQRIGGKRGWYYGNWLWQIRGFLDLIVGGVGMRRGRRDPKAVRVGDTIDFWRVEAFETNKRLRLLAEMKVPGRAWLEFEVLNNNGQTRVCQTATFDPHGLFGQIYWYMLYPLHQFIFSGMLKNIIRNAESNQQ